jgi:hypothetical protein
MYTEGQAISDTAIRDSMRPAGKAAGWASIEVSHGSRIPWQNVLHLAVAAGHKEDSIGLTQLCRLDPRPKDNESAQEKRPRS